MPSWIPVPIADGDFVKPSGVNGNNNTLAAVLAALDTLNIASKFTSNDVNIELREAETRGSFIPPADDGTWYVRGWAIEQTGFAGADTATFALQVITDSGGVVGTLSTAPAVVAGSTLTRIALTTATLTSSQGIRVALAAGAIPAGCKVTFTVHTAKVLRKSTEL